MKIYEILFFSYNCDSLPATSKYVKKDKAAKAVEEVIDVVGDFGPPKATEPYQIENENFGVAFDAANIQPMMINPQGGKLVPISTRFKILIIFFNLKMITTVSRQRKR